MGAREPLDAVVRAALWAVARVLGADVVVVAVRQRAAAAGAGAHVAALDAVARVAVVARAVVQAAVLARGRARAVEETAVARARLPVVAVVGRHVDAGAANAGAARAAPDRVAF